MNYLLENNFLSVSINDMGAELTSIYDKEKKQEVLWQKDPSFWNRQAPVLFPNVGKHYLNHFTHKGKEYVSSQHGFARDSVFSCIEENTDSLTFRLQSNDTTLQSYPFPFVLDIRYTLKGRDLNVEWFVSNTGSETMYFTIGGHPAFRVPVLPNTKRSDYKLMFRQKDPEYLLINMKTGTAYENQKYVLKLNSDSCTITDELFDKDALIFDQQLDWAGISYPDGSPYISMSFPNFYSFGIWSAMPCAPFVCLEPWEGRCDNYGFSGELKDRPGIRILETGQQYYKYYTITIH